MNNDIPIIDRVNYVTDETYIQFPYLWEYDISKANITMLRIYGLLDDSEYHDYVYMDKRTREIDIGKRIAEEKGADTKKHPSITEQTIKKGIMEAKHRFLEVNQINETDIVRIANDSILFCKPPGNPIKNAIVLNEKHAVEFKLSARGTSFIKLGKVWILFDSESMNAEIKGISKENQHLHANFLGAICEVLFLLERMPKKQTLYRFNSLYKKYIERELDISFYREFNADSAYRIKSNTEIKYGIKTLMKYIPIDYIDISYNLAMLRELYRIINTV